MGTASIPPGPKRHLLSGNLPEFRRDMLAFLTRCARDYGDVVSVRLGPRRFIMLNQPAYIEEVLVTNSRNFGKHYAFRFNRLLLGNGLLSSGGEFWLRQRRLAQPAFNRSRIARYGAIMVESAERLTAGWRDGDTRDLHAEMARLTLDIVAETLFGADIEGQQGDVGEAIEITMNHFTTRIRGLVMVPNSLPTPLNLRMRRAVRQLDTIIYRIIGQRRAAGEDRGDLLSMLLHARDEDDGRGMTDQQLRDEVMTLFLAGYETTALALSWTWYLLALHPEAEGRLLAECRHVLAGRLPTADDLPHLRYTEQVVLESMRLYPPAYILGREALAEFEIGGYRVPAGTTIWLSQWVMHRHPRYFDRPDQFEPDRWANDLATRLPRYVYFPFGAGPRQCIGNAFAMMEMILVLATIGQKFHFTCLPGPPVIPRPAFTLRPTGGMPLVLSRR
jgi:cytochrome P450